MRPYLWRALAAVLPDRALPPDGVFTWADYTTALTTPEFGAAISPYRTSRPHSPRSQASRRRMARRVGGYKWGRR